ncbi:MAG TPA: hypothetical protein VGZ73_11845 [Bryobacteraceae bacterium]|jgi:hypothetical protein|nr:hypothetical protein [Bryobacteraceae bacterium]
MRIVKEEGACFMRSVFLLVAVCPVALFSQTVENDHALLQKLIAEIQQLRLAIERSTIMSARTQLAMQELQFQENRTASLTRSLDDIRAATSHDKAERARLGEAIRTAEDKRSSPAFAAPQTHDDLEAQIRQLKLELELRMAADQRDSAHEAELTGELQAAQRAVQDSRSRIADLTKALDNAVQQMLKAQ